MQTDFVYSKHATFCPVKSHSDN